MESAVGQFVERLFQPIALGLLFVLFVPPKLLAVILDGQSAPALPLAEQVGDQIDWIGTLLLLFVFGQFFAVLGQIVFSLGMKLDPDVRRETFFSRVHRLDNPLVERRYDAIRFQVDLLCGIGGVGLVCTALWLAGFLWTDLRPAHGPAGLVLAAIAFTAAMFHALEFKRMLIEVGGA